MNIFRQAVAQLRVHRIETIFLDQISTQKVKLMKRGPGKRRC